MATVKAYPHIQFDEYCCNNGIDDSNVENEFKDKAFISITCTEGVQNHYLEEEEKHWFQTNHKNVLNIEFDDIRHNMEFDDYTAYAITNEQADIMAKFIEDNIGKDFICHCRCARSRSVAVVRYILLKYPELYKWRDSVTPDVDLSTPNITVLTKLNSAYNRLHGIDMQREYEKIFS